MGVTVTGQEASVRWSYLRAAVLGSWTLTRDDEQHCWLLSAFVASTDTFRLSQTPLVFEAPHAKGVWRWPVMDLQIVGVSLNARLGPKER